jgi:L-arabinose isomerase
MLDDRIRIMTDSISPLKIALVTPVADLYNRLWPDIGNSLYALAGRMAQALQIQGESTVTCHRPVSTAKQFSTLFKDLEQDELDLVIVALAPYCPSGVQIQALLETPLPLLLWPMQEIFELKPDQYDNETIKLNHGVHAVQDLAAVLTRHGRAFGVIHGHVQQADFRVAMHAWAKAGHILRVMQQARPLQIGGHFEQMLDLQIGDTAFVRDMGLEPTVISLEALASLIRDIDESAVQEHLTLYSSLFDVDPGVETALLAQTARGDIALHRLLEQHSSQTCALNFLTLCNDARIGDGLHIAASRLMRVGGGYAGEGDWVTAVLVRAMQQGFGCASFSEMFTVGYADNRILLKHWGEGNIRMARARPRMIRSQFMDQRKAEFAVADFEFAPGPAMLVNLGSHFAKRLQNGVPLNATPDEKGHLISVAGCITDDHLPNVEGPRAVFKPEAEDVRELLNCYVYAGGTHHLALVYEPHPDVLEKLCLLSGWQYTAL